MKTLENTASIPSFVHWRSAIKSVSWRIVATLSTILLVWMITGKAEWAITVGSLEMVLKLVLYYFHELAWEKIPNTRD